MKKTILLIMALATLLTTACTVSDNPSFGGDNNTGAGDHNVRRYMPITANTESNNWWAAGCMAGDANNLFFMNIEDGTRRLYCRNEATGKLTILLEEENPENVFWSRYAFIEDGYFYYCQLYNDSVTFNRVKTDLSQLPEKDYRKEKGIRLLSAFARQGKTIYFNSYDNAHERCIKTWNLHTGEIKIIDMPEDIKNHVALAIEGRNLIAYKFIVVDNTIKYRIAKFDMTTGNKTILVEECNKNNKGTIMGGRLYYFDNNSLYSIDLDGNNLKTHLTDINIILINSHDGLIYIYAKDPDTNQKSLYTYKPGDISPQMVANDSNTMKLEISPYGDVAFFRSFGNYYNSIYYRGEKTSGTIKQLVPPGSTPQRLETTITDRE